MRKISRLAVQPSLARISAAAEAQSGVTELSCARSAYCCSFFSSHVVIVFAEARQRHSGRPVLQSQGGMKTSGDQEMRPR
jgi:hypothetical protein